jgi:hypothetical protein
MGTDGGNENQNDRQATKREGNSNEHTARQHTTITWHLAPGTYTYDSSIDHIKSKY